MRLFLFMFILSLFSCRNLYGQTYPQYKITTYDTASKGYYFLCPINGLAKTKHDDPTQIILDGEGRVVYYKVFTSGLATGDFKVWPNGMMSYYYRNQYFLMDSNFTIIDSVVIKNGYIPDLHDMQILPNGHYLLMGIENDTMDLSSYHYFNGIDSAGSKKAIVSCGVIQEQDQNKNVVFEWHAKDHFKFNDVDSVYLNSPTNVDWTHFNAFAYDNDSNILLSVRWFDEITKINRKNGSIIWRLGGKRNQFTFENDSNGFIGQHDIRRIDNGDITMYDNGIASPFHPATAREYKLDETKHVANLVWSYINNPKSYSIAIGNVQRNPNGNTLIDYGIVPDDNLVFNVLNASGKKVFEILFEDSLVSYRSFNYVTLPWRLKRPQISCFLSNGKYYLDAGSGYGRYIWNTGDTTQTIELTKGDTFSVFVPIGQGGFICSDYFIASTHTDPCSLTSVNGKMMEPDFSIFPNPATDELIIRSSSFGNKEIPVEINDVTGRFVYQSKSVSSDNNISINVASLQKGIYILKLSGLKQMFVKD